MKPSFVTFALPIIALLAACGDTPVHSASGPPFEIVLKSDLFEARPPVISIDEIHDLSEQQRREFYRYFYDTENQDKAPHKRVSDYLELFADGFSYRGETFTASEALEHSAGNCLALAILTTGLARLVNVDVEYQLIDSAPVFEARGNHVRRSLHVRSLLIDPGWESPEGFLTLSPPGIRIDYFPSRFDRFVGNIDESEYFAMYYRNIAADAIEKQDLDQAYWLLMESIELSPASPETLNMLAIVFDRAGDKRKCEEIYRYGIQHAARRVSLIRNYSIFLKRESRISEAEDMDALLAEQDDPNPFDWIFAAEEAYDEGDLRLAMRLFRKSVELAPYLHEGHFGLAKTYFRLGNLSKAEQELEEALTHATRSAARQRYEAKLAALSDYRSEQ